MVINCIFIYLNDLKKTFDYEPKIETFSKKNIPNFNSYLPRKPYLLPVPCLNP